MALSRHGFSKFQMKIAKKEVGRIESLCVGKKQRVMSSFLHFVSRNDLINYNKFKVNPLNSYVSKRSSSHRRHFPR